MHSLFFIIYLLIHLFIFEDSKERKRGTLPHKPKSSNPKPIERPRKLSLFTSIFIFCGEHSILLQLRSRNCIEINTRVYYSYFFVRARKKNSE